MKSLYLILEELSNKELQDAVKKAERETDTNPTEEQKESGEYDKGIVNIQEFEIHIEQPAGSTRSGTDEVGNKWSCTMNNTYGYIGDTKGKDGDAIDIFLGDTLDCSDVFVIDQINKDKSFDEHKVMFGFKDIKSAEKAYLSNYEKGWTGLGTITKVDIETFRKWIKNPTKKQKQFCDYKEIQNLKESLNNIKYRL